MKKYFGELGEVLPKISLVFNSKDKTDSFELSRSFNLVFNPFLAIQNLDIHVGIKVAINDTQMLEIESITFWLMQKCGIMCLLAIIKQHYTMEWIVMKMICFLIKTKH